MIQLTISPSQIDSIKHLVLDSIQKSNAINPIDLINKVDGFYNNAWGKIIILITVVTGIIGIVIPLIMNHIQLSRNQQENTRITTDIQNGLAKDKEILKTELQNYINTQLEDFDKKLTVFQHATEGVAYDIQASSFIDKGDYKSAFANYITALTCYYIGEDYSNFENALDDLIEKCSTHINKNALAEIALEYSEYCDVKKLIEKLENPLDKHYLNYISRLKIMVSDLEKNV